MATALVVIDVQKEFFSPKGILGSRCFSTELVNEVNKLVSSKSWDLVVWIRSEYDNRPVYNEDGNRVTHFGRRQCCIANTELSELMDDLNISSSSPVLVKKFFSSFLSTGLDALLKSKSVSNLHLAGLTANTCVLSTFQDALDLGYNVVLEEKCIFATSPELRKKSLRQMRDMLPAVDDRSNLLYIVNGSIPSWRVQMLLHEYDMPFRTRRLRVLTVPKETKSDEFLKINPRGKTPVYIDREAGVKIAESMGILRYIQSRVSGPDKLLPRGGPVELARCLQRTYEADLLEYKYEDMELVLKLVYQGDEAKHIRQKIKAAYDASMDELKFWEAYARESEFIAGPEFSLADCTFYPTLAYLVHRGLDLNSFPALCRYYGKVSKRQSAIRSLPVGWHRGNLHRHLT